MLYLLILIVQHLLCLMHVVIQDHKAQSGQLVIAVQLVQLATMGQLVILVYKELPERQQILVTQDHKALMERLLTEGILVHKELQDHKELLVQDMTGQLVQLVIMDRLDMMDPLGILAQ